jgi:hypothetical protein
VLDASNCGEEIFEFQTAQAEGPDVRSDDVFTQLAIHLYDDRSRDSWFCHDQMITFDPRDDTPRQLANVAQLLPRNASHAVALRTFGAW